MGLKCSVFLCRRPVVGECSRCGRYFCTAHGREGRCDEHAREWEEQQGRQAADEAYKKPYNDALERGKEKNGRGLCGVESCQQHPNLSCSVCGIHFCGSHLTESTYEIAANCADDKGDSVNRRRGPVCGMCLRYHVRKWSHHWLVGPHLEVRRSARS